MSLESLEEVVDGGPATGDGEVDLTAEVFGGDDDVTGLENSDDAILAGYEVVNGSGDKPAGGEGSDTTGGAASDGTADEPAAAAAQPKRIGRWTEDELAQRLDSIDGLKKSTETVAGIVGSLKERLERAATPRKIQASDLKNVTEQFGEDFTVALVDDLNALGLGGAAAPTQAEIDASVQALVAQQAQEIEQRLEYKAVLRRHKDADSFFIRQGADGKPVVGAHAVKFREWIATLPAERQQEIANAWDRDVVSSYIGEFKKVSAAPPANQQQGSQQQSTAAQRANRIKNARTPQSSGGRATPPAEDPLVAGYREAKAGR